MSDSIKRTTELKIDNLFVDGDTRTITLKNPKSNITTQEITELQTFMNQKNIIIGDKYGGTFGRINSVTKVTDERVYLDLAD